MGNFEELVEQYTPMIYHIIKTLHIYKNTEEFFQTGLIALWEAHERFNCEKGKFSTFAYSYIKGRIMTELTKQSKIEERSVYPEETFWEMSIDENGGQPLQLATLLSYCASLTEKQRKWVIYTFYYGMTTKEIAECEMVSASAVKKWRAGALPKIKANIEGGLF